MALVGRLEDLQSAELFDSGQRAVDLPRCRRNDADLSGSPQTARTKERFLPIFSGPAPDEVIAIPIVVDGMMAAVFYGDDVPKGDAFGSLSGSDREMGQEDAQ